MQGELSVIFSNGSTWSSFPHKNEYKIKYDHFVAAEQEFNTFKYGIKGKIDGTLLFRDP